MAETCNKPVSGDGYYRCTLAADHPGDCVAMGMGFASKGRTTASPLHLVAAAAGARQYAERSYREAIVEAEKTCSRADIARAAGVSRQAIQSMLRSLGDGGEPELTVEEMEKRIAYLDKRQTSVIDAIARRYRQPTDKLETLRRNTNNGTITKGPGAKGYHKAARIGRLQTVTEDRELAASMELDQFIENHPSEPAVLTYLAERRELLALRERIETLTWPEWARA